MEVQPGPLPDSGEPTNEASAVPSLGSKDSSEKPYRAILNGRAELMEVLGGIFNMQSAPGFYFWFWPFKHLIDHGEKLRARLIEEELKFRDSDQGFKYDVPPPVANKAEDVPPKDESRPKAEQAPDILKARNSVQDLNLERKNEERTASEEAELAGRDATEIVSKNVNHETKADSITVDEGTEDVKAKHSSQAVKPDTQTSDTRLRDELRCLVNFMDTDLKELFSVQKDIDNGSRRLIAFDHLWQLYKPGHVVISGKGQKRAYVVLHVTGGRTLQRNSQYVMAKDDASDIHDPKRRKEKEAYFAKYSKASPFVIDCFYLDFDGTNFGPLPQKFMLQEYEGEVAITSLEVFPIRFDADPKKTEKSLVRRGRKFVKLAGVDHKYYSGRTLREDMILEVPGEVGSLAFFHPRAMELTCDRGPW